MPARTLEYMLVADLIPAEVNPKGHDLDGIRASIDRFGVIEITVLDERTGRILSGHGRTETLAIAEAEGINPPDGVLLREDGRWTVPVIRGWASTDDDDAAAALIGVNHLVEKGGWKADELASLLDGLSQRGEELLVGTGYDRIDLDALLASLTDPNASHEHQDPDDTPFVPAVPFTEVGDVWQLGRHRLVCGDSYDPDVQALALDSRRPGAVFTDPPYGMALDTDFAKVHTVSGHRGHTYDPVIGDDVPFDASAILAAYDDVAEQFWWGADYYRLTLPDGGSWVVWDKRGVDGEGIFDRVYGNHFELCWSRQPHRREIARIVWAGHFGMQREDTRSRVHPTQKPTALVEWFFARWVKPEVLVFDPFAGSGSTMVGCERTGRSAAMCELSPVYCDVIAARFQMLTGELPVRNGEPVDLVALVGSGANVTTTVRP